MRIIMAVFSLALLNWAGPASAQATYTATVSVHSDLPPLDSGQVTKIMAAAANVLKTDSDGQTCAVTFELKGPVGSFGSKTEPKVIKTEAQRDAVHKVDSEKKDAIFHIKVVEAIYFCTPPQPDAPKPSFNGCAWPTDLPSIIVVHPAKHKDTNGHPIPKFPDHLLWVHEFGHLTGLPHRDKPDVAWLMTGCPITPKSVNVTEHECYCLRNGLDKCGKRPEQKYITCPKS